ncbi:hypothetical protein GCM10012282_72740 [Streptomyces lacrimifluminis]|uniref:Uncharacterized protein n=1 Tax=Streptomyces lacrimifluminis TaxID=1500077 RepID=A0A917UKX3_9ACTN|nr:hypothetical protein GCM10012282_72740 [Streptomyces lacrimifluminis]
MDAAFAHMLLCMALSTQEIHALISGTRSPTPAPAAGQIHLRQHFERQATEAEMQVLRVELKHYVYHCAWNTSSGLE